MRITLKLDSGNGNSLATETVHIEPQCIPALTANSKRVELRNGIRSMLTNMPAAQALVTANRWNVYIQLVPALTKILFLFDSHPSAKIEVILTV